MIKPEDIEVLTYPDIKSKGGQYKNKELALIMLEMVIELNG